MVIFLIDIFKTKKAIKMLYFSKHEYPANLGLKLF